GVSGSRNIARHNDLFPPDAALQMMKKYLTPHGEIQLLIPETEESNWMSALPSLGLKCIHVTRCRPKPDKAVNRLFLKIGHEAKLQTQDELCIYVSEKEYTSEVKALLTPFYLDSAWVKKGF